MNLSMKQQNFTSCIGKLIAYADIRGYGLTFGDAYRDRRVFGEFGEQQSYSSKNSMHKIRLAVDFNLFLDDKYISDGDHEAWLDLGLYWEELDPDACWGGKFESKDSNHFSFQHWGCK